MTVTSTSSTSATGATQTNALSSISSNYNEFLTLLTTQLQNQDPSNPTDTSQFTSELAQFAGVEQQVTTNTNLTSLIQLTQSQQVLQGATMLGKQVDLNSTTLPLQNGAAHLDFVAPAAQPAIITVTNAAGTIVTQQTIAANAGSNGWDWNGQNAAGVTQPDGPYTANVVGNGANGATTALAETTRGIVTGVSRDASAINLQLGATSIDLSSVVNVQG